MSWTISHLLSHSWWESCMSAIPSGGKMICSRLPAPLPLSVLVPLRPLLSAAGIKGLQKGLLYISLLCIGTHLGPPDNLQ